MSDSSNGHNGLPIIWPEPPPDGHSQEALLLVTIAGAILTTLGFEDKRERERLRRDFLTYLGWTYVQNVDLGRITEDQKAPLEASLAWLAEVLAQDKAQGYWETIDEIPDRVKEIWREMDEKP